MEISDLNRILPSFLLSFLSSYLSSFLLSNFFCLFFPYSLPSHTVFCSHILILFLIYRHLLSSFSFDFFYFTVSLVQLICFSFVIHCLKYLPFVLFKNDNSAYRLWGPSAYSVGTGGRFHWGWNGRDVKLTIHLHLVVLHLYSSIAFMPYIGTILLSLSASLSSFCSHSYFVLPFRFCFFGSYFV